eukprot:CAMPEP_0116974892 /NCGR_PEP_ID=MMETSP0467-20121206/55463_1 /TAXON_ID=283647 /ORGANISM="Mesodinium pulex, Strain SPMC105" /LENGTH=57 /DNA_ID=CAMNT_0004667171 /DNA_START=596 /DNA_END=766 /DNA_ORIENTATION=-
MTRDNMTRDNMTREYTNFNREQTNGTNYNFNNTLEDEMNFKPESNALGHKRHKIAKW